MARGYSEDRQQQPDKTNHHDTLFHLYLILTKDKIWKVAERTRRCCNAGSNHQWLTLARVCLFALFSFSRRAGGAWFCLLRGVSVYYCHHNIKHSEATAVVDWHYVNTTEFNWSESETSLCLKETSFHLPSSCVSTRLNCLFTFNEDRLQLRR